MRSSIIRRRLVGVQMLLPGFELSPCRGGFVPVCCSSWLLVLRSCQPSGTVPCGAAAGSALLLSSSSFVAAVAGGACPVGLALASFSHWPLRSAVLLSLLRVLSSPRVRSAVLAGAVPRGLLVSFCRAGLSSLGFSVSGRFASRPDAVRRFLSRFSPVAVPSFFVVSVSSRALCSAFSSLVRCLSWLSSRGSGCPGALRPALAALVRTCLLFLL